MIDVAAQKISGTDAGSHGAFRNESTGDQSFVMSPRSAPFCART